MVVTSAPSAWTASTLQRLHAAAVEVDGAGAAVAGVAADHGAGLAELLAQVLHQQHPGLDVVGDLRPVDGEVDLGHGSAFRGSSAVMALTLGGRVGERLRARPSCASAGGRPRAGP